MIVTSCFKPLWNSNAFFEIRGQPNWQDLAGAMRLGLTDTSTNEDLVQALEDILVPLQDGHVSVYTDDEEFVTSDEMGIFQQFAAEFLNQTDVADLDNYIEQQVWAWWQILNSFMVGGLKGEAGGLLWGQLAASPRTGYLQMII